MSGFCAIANMLFWPMAFTLPNSLRAAGDAVFTMVVSLTTMFVCRVALSYVFACSWGLGLGLLGLGYGWPCSATGSSVRSASCGATGAAAGRRSTSSDPLPHNPSAICKQPEAACELRAVFSSSEDQKYGIIHVPVRAWHPYQPGRYTCRRCS